VALAAITELYREIMPEGGAVLDVMSSWIGHLPPEIDYRKVVGIGVDACILAENPFLDEWRVQDLNQNPVLPFGDSEFERRGNLRRNPAFDPAGGAHP